MDKIVSKNTAHRRNGKPVQVEEADVIAPGLRKKDKPASGPDGLDSLASDKSASTGRHFINGLAKGLAMIQVFNEQKVALTLSEAAQCTGLTRATARRVLMTLEDLGFVARSDERHFILTPRVLSLGYAYLSTMPFWAFASPVLESLVEELGATCSISVLDDTELVYVMRIPIHRILSYTGVTIGSRLPVHCNSMGRVLLADLNETQLDSYFDRARLTAYTERTITDVMRLSEVIAQTRRKGYAWVNGEMEEHVGGLSVPVYSPEGRVIAALNASVNQSQSSAQSESAILDRFLPAVKRAAERLNASLLVQINHPRRVRSGSAVRSKRES